MPAAKQSATLNLSTATTLDSIDLRVAEPNDDQRRRLGTFFILLKVDEIPSLLPWLPSFAPYLEQSFYQTLEAEPGIPVERALGIVRQRARVKLQQVIHQTRTIAIDGVHYVAGSLKGRVLSLTHTGEVHVYLMHRRPEPNDTSRQVQWVDVTGTPAGKTSSGGKGHTGSDATVVSGTIGESDIVVVGTESLFEVVGLAKLERTLTTSPIEAARSILEHDLKLSGSRVGFGALFLQRPAATPEPSREHVTTSMTKLLAKETGTADLLTPTPSILKQITKPKPKNPFPATPTAARPARTPNPALQPSRGLGRIVGSLLRTVASSLQKAGIWLVLAPIGLVKTLVSPSERREWFQRLKAWPVPAADRLLTRLHRLPRSSQRLLIIAFLFAFLFIQSLVFLADRQSRTTTSAEQQQLITNIQDALDRADSDLIYHNDTEAASLLASATANLNLLPHTSTSDQQRWAILSARLDDIHTRLQHLVPIPSPTTIVQLPAASFPNPSGLLATTKGLVVYNSLLNQVIGVISPTTNQLTITNDHPTMQGTITAATVTEQGLAGFLTDAPAIVTYDAGSHALTQISITSATHTAKSLAFYHNRLYLLDPTTKQIIRHQHATGGYQSGVPWVEGNIDQLASGTDIAIDGSVYVLLNDGSLIKFFNGALQNWQGATPVDPATAASRLIDPANAPYLFAMDKTSKRIFVWSKDTGALVRQFTFPNLDQIIDFSVDDKASLLTILTPTSIVSTPITISP